MENRVTDVDETVVSDIPISDLPSGTHVSSDSHITWITKATPVGNLFHSSVDFSSERQRQCLIPLFFGKFCPVKKVQFERKKRKYHQPITQNLCLNYPTSYLSLPNLIGQSRKKDWIIQSSRIMTNIGTGFATNKES
jgi:hypothetical protein